MNPLDTVIQRYVRGEIDDRRLYSVIFQHQLIMLNVSEEIAGGQVSHVPLHVFEGNAGYVMAFTTPEAADRYRAKAPHARLIVGHRLFDMASQHGSGVALIASDGGAIRVEPKHVAEIARAVGSERFPEVADLYPPEARASDPGKASSGGEWWLRPHDAVRRMHAGSLSIEQTIGVLLESQVAVPLAGPPELEGNHVKSWNPAKVANDRGERFLLAFTSDEYSARFCRNVPAYSYQLVVRTDWLVRVVAREDGIVFNINEKETFRWSSRDIALSRARL
jgi:hypothetical protein